MKFPYILWTVAIPEGGHCPFLTRGTRAECISAFDGWHPDLTWARARRNGWRIVKLSVSLANTKSSEPEPSAPDGRTGKQSGSL